MNSVTNDDDFVQMFFDSILVITKRQYWIKRRNENFEPKQTNNDKIISQWKCESEFCKWYRKYIYLCLVNDVEYEIKEWIEQNKREKREREKKTSTFTESKMYT